MSPGYAAAPDRVAEGGVDQVGAGSLRILPTTADVDDVPHGHALLLTMGGRRRVVLSTGAADRAVRRAHGRGDVVSVELVRLVPVGGERS
jgi:hypothetical protein